jgi:hypothetical protein
LKDDFAESQNVADSNPEKLYVMVQAMIAQLEAEEALYPVDADGNELHPILPTI